MMYIVIHLQTHISEIQCNKNFVEISWPLLKRWLYVKEKIVQNFVFYYLIIYFIKIMCPLHTYREFIQFKNLNKIISVIYEHYSRNNFISGEIFYDEIKASKVFF